MSDQRGHRAGRWRRQLPEPDLGWIRWAPQPWAGPAGGVWTDMGRAGLAWGRGEAGKGEHLPALGEELDDVVYLPPTTMADRPAVLAAAAALRERGTPVLVQMVPGDEWSPDDGDAAIYDLLPGLWHGDLEVLDRVPEGATAVWPLIRGVTDAEKMVSAGLERLRRADVTTVIGLPLDLSPGDRREVVRTHGDGVFDLVFHSEGASARRFAMAAHRAGLRWWLDRPLPSAPSVTSGNRRLSAALLAIGSLWLRLDESPVQGQAFYRAARWIDTSHYNVAALLREGNLDVVEAVDRASHDALCEVVESGGSSLLEELRGRYVEAAIESAESDG